MEACLHSEVNPIGLRKDYEGSAHGSAQQKLNRILPGISPAQEKKCLISILEKLKSFWLFSLLISFTLTEFHIMEFACVCYPWPALFLPSSFSHPEDGADMFPQNVS
jgi:hypothetical protein